MYTQHLKRIFDLFQYRLMCISKEQGASQEYIQGQLNEARHQLEILGKKLHGGNQHGF